MDTRRTFATKQHRIAGYPDDYKHDRENDKFPTAAELGDLIGGAISQGKMLGVFFVGVPRNPMPEQIIGPAQPRVIALSISKTMRESLETKVRKFSRVRTARRESSVTVASAERPWPSSIAISPKKSP